MAYDNTNFYGDLIVSEYDDKGNFMTPQTPTGYYVYHILGDGFDLMSEMCNQFMNDYSILTASTKSLDNFWGVSYNMPRPSLPYLYTVLFEDVGTTIDSNLNHWYWVSNYGTGSVDDDGTTFTATSTSRYLTVSALTTEPYPNVNIYLYDFPFTVEFDIVSYNDPNTTGAMTRVRIYNANDNHNAYWNFKDYGVGHYKIVCTEGSQKLYFNGVEQSRKFTFTTTNGHWDCSLQTYGHIKFKNFRIEGIVYHNIYFDDATTDTNSRYYINSAGGTSLTWNNGYLVLTLGSIGRYARLRTSQYDVNNLIGKKIHFEAEIDADTSAYVQLLDDSTGNVYTRATGNEITNGVSQLEYAIPSNCTQVLFQIMPKDQRGSGGTIKFKNFKIYDMENPIYSTRLMTDEEYKIYLYLRNCRLMTREDIEINMNKCFAIEGQNIFFTTETNYLSAVSHLDYVSRDTGTSNIAKNLEDDTLNFITDFEGDEETLTFESGLSVVEEVVEVVNVPANNYDPAFLELLEKYISVKGNLKIKEYSI